MQRSCGMADPLPALVETSLQIAWDYLGGVGEIADPHETAEFLLRSIQTQVLRDETRTLMLSNRAIEAFRVHPVRLVNENDDYKIIAPRHHRSIPQRQTLPLQLVYSSGAT